MYETHWMLDRPPFEEAHDPAFFVDSDILGLARAKLHYAAGHGQSATAVVGPPGVGKTALVRQFLREAEAAGWACSLVVNPLGDAFQTLDCIARDLGGHAPNPLEALRAALGALAQAGRRACIVVDEAHTIERTELLETFRMLLNFEVGGRLPLTLVLAGQESLLERLRRASGFDQRLAYTVSLRSMDVLEGKHYILSRLKAAGCQRGIFTRNAGERICELSGGVARHINRLCELCLVVGYGFGLKKIKEDIVAMVAKDLGLPREVEEPPRAAALREEGTGRFPVQSLAPRPATETTQEEDILSGIPAPPAPRAAARPSRPVHPMEEFGFPGPGEPELRRAVEREIASRATKTPLPLPSDSDAVETPGDLLADLARETASQEFDGDILATF